MRLLIGGSDMAKATKDAADRVEQAAAGVADPLPAGSTGKEEEDPLLVTALRETKPDRLPDGGVDLADLFGKLDKGSQHGGCIAYHIGVELVRQKQAAKDAAGGRTKGVLDKWYKDATVRVGRKESAIRLYMKIAQLIDENMAKTTTPLRLSVLARPLREVQGAINNVMAGRRPDENAEKAKDDNKVQRWKSLSSGLIGKAEAFPVPISEIELHIENMKALSYRLGAGVAAVDVPELTVPQAWVVQKGRPLIMYPGGKASYSDKIVALLRRMAIQRRVGAGKVAFIEPFVGGGSIANAVARTCSDVFSSLEIHDKNQSVALTYQTVFERLDELEGRLQALQLTYDEWVRMQEMARDVEGDHDQLELAVATLVTQETGRSSYGSVNPTPHADFREQWDARKCCTRLRTYRDELTTFWNAHPGRGAFRCSTADAFDIISESSVGDVLYVDPPYVEAGNDLYTLGFGVRDHIRLKETLDRTSAAWLLSYDNHAMIRQLYASESMVVLPARSSNDKDELLIWPKAINLFMEGDEPITPDSPIGKYLAEQEKAVADRRALEAWWAAGMPDSLLPEGYVKQPL